MPSTMRSASSATATASSSVWTARTDDFTLRLPHNRAGSNGDASNRGGAAMAAFNVVRCRVKPGREFEFIDAHRKGGPEMKGFAGGWVVKTGERTFCIIGQWRRFLDIVNARPQMITMLDGMRDMLEDLGDELGVTDPV